MSDTMCILIVDPDAIAGQATAQMLSDQGYANQLVANGDRAIAALEQDRLSADPSSIGVAMIDLDGLGPTRGIELIRTLHDDWPAVVAVMVSAYRKVETAVQAMRLGAADYLLKPVVIDELIDAVGRAEQRHLLHIDSESAQPPLAEVENQAPRPPAQPSTPVPSIEDWSPIPLSDAMKEPERQYILRALEANGWNRGQTAQQLDINRTTLYKKIRQYRLDEPA